MPSLAMAARASLPLLALCAGLTLAGCPAAVVPDGTFLDLTREAGTGYLPDGADPFRHSDGALGDAAVDGDGGAWVLPDGSTVTGDERYGYIRLGLYRYAGTDYTTAAAEFRYQFRPDDPRCTTVAVGEWYVSDCAEDGMDPPDPHPLPFPHAGTLRVTGGNQPLNLAASRTGQYNTLWDTSLRFAPGQRLTLRAEGGTVPAFTEMLTIPADLGMRAPGTEAGVLRRDRDLTVEWAPGTADKVYVYLQQRYGPDSSPRRISLSSERYGDEGRATVPAVVLRRLQPSATSRATVQVVPYNYLQRRIGGWPVSIWVSGRGASATLAVQ
jgi:hypothetical protein